jgi:hypothetical protein
LYTHATVQYCNSLLQDSFAPDGAADATDTDSDENDADADECVTMTLDASVHQEPHELQHDDFVVLRGASEKEQDLLLHRVGDREYLLGRNQTRDKKTYWRCVQRQLGSVCRGSAIEK